MQYYNPYIYDIKLDLMFKKILRILTYNWDGDNICGDGVRMKTLVMGMGWGWGQDAWGWGQCHGDGVRL